MRILGCGLVSATVVEYLYRDKDFLINICYPVKSELKHLADRYPLIRSTYIDVRNDRELLTSLLTQLCYQNDVVVSLLPTELQVVAADYCIKTKTHLVTASYASDDMQQLHKAYLKIAAD